MTMNQKKLNEQSKLLDNISSTVSAASSVPLTNGPSATSKYLKVKGHNDHPTQNAIPQPEVEKHQTNGISITISPVDSLPESFEGRHEGQHEEGQQPVTNCGSLCGKIIAILGLLYLFVCSLGFLSDSFRLIAGRAAGEVLQKEKLISNPIVGVMMGILVTVAVQSSSTSTSIVVSMVASGLFTVKTAIPIIMGANIGTSVTNTVVALTHMTNREDFERAFGGAVLHDMFNLLTVSSLLLLEQCTSYLEVTTTKILNSLDLNSKHGGEIQVLSVLTKPFTSLIVQIDKAVIVGWSINDPRYDNARLMKTWCNSTSHSQLEDDETAERNHTNYGNDSVVLGDDEIERSDNSSAKNQTIETHGQRCKFLFNLFNFGDLTIGIILLAISLFLLCGCLILLVKVLSSLLKGKLAVAVQKAVNADIPYFPCLTGYLAIGIGAIMTLLVQSSSVFTSALTPLIALGMITLERAYPLTLGSNLGTTTTAMLAALATEGPNLRPSIQLALCHFLFNLTGILLFYPIPCTRFPIRMARALGSVTAKYRWFAVFYLVFMFVLLPLIVFTLSLMGPVAFYIVAAPSGIVLLAAMILNFFQRWTPTFLPIELRCWKFLPIWLHSLEPYDRIVQEVILFFNTTCFGSSGPGGLRENRSSQINFLNRSHSSTNGFENAGFSRNDKSFLSLSSRGGIDVTSNL